MTVKELRKMLKTFRDQDMEVMIHSGGYGPKLVGSARTSYERQDDDREYLVVVLTQ